MSVSFLTENKTMQTIRARVAFHSRQHGFDKCMQQLLDPDQAINASLIAELYAYWGDPLTPADEHFMRSCVAEAGTAEGPILLAGASLLTLILGAASAKTGKSQVWCLESDRHWANLVRSWLTEYRISTAHVIQSPPRLYDDFVWYAVDTGRLAKSYQLAICEGGRASPRGAVGVLERLAPRLDERFTLLARNVKETAVLKHLNDWAKQNGAKIALIDKHEGFVKLARQAPAADATGPATSTRAANPAPPRAVPDSGKSGAAAGSAKA